MLYEFILDNCTPGDVLDPDEMLELYHVLCDRTGLVPRPWRTVATGLRLRMPAGPKGSGKPCHNFLQFDGTLKKRRGWYVPARSSAKARSRRRDNAEPQQERIAA